MAGIGFQLKKLFADDTLFGKARAYAFASIVTVGPMILSMLMIVGIQRSMAAYGVPFPERELFLATSVYAFAFSALMTGGIAMTVTRYLADMLYRRLYDRLLPSYYGALTVCLPIAALTAAVFLAGADAGIGYKIAAYFLFLEICVVWLQTVYLSALRDYMRIVRHYAFAVITAVTGAWLQLAFTPYRDATYVLAVLDGGLLALALSVGRVLARTFPPGDGGAYFFFLRYIRQYPSLFAIGTLAYAGGYVHHAVYWFGCDRFAVAGRFVVSPFYDLPAFYAYLTVIPTLVKFVVSVETDFLQEIPPVLRFGGGGGNIRELEVAKAEMYRTLSESMGGMMKTQLVFTMMSLAAGSQLLPRLGFSSEQMDAFNILLLGNYFYIFAFCGMLLLLYYDDRKGALWISALYFTLNAALTALFLPFGHHGLGMFLAAFLTLVATLGRLRHYVRDIDYYTFCAQPFVPTRQHPRPRWRFSGFRRTRTDLRGGYSVRSRSAFKMRS